MVQPVDSSTCQSQGFVASVKLFVCLECEDKIFHGPQLFSEPDLVGNILALALQHSGQIRSSSSGFK
jgi:hypothetical protein